MTTTVGIATTNPVNTGSPAWTNPTNVYADDNVTATSSPTASGASSTMQLGGFTNLVNIPSGDTLTTAQVVIESSVNATAQTPTITVQPYLSTTAIGTAVQVPLTTTLTVQTVTLNTVTLAQIRDVNFRLQIVATRGGSQARTFTIDYAQMLITHQTPPIAVTANDAIFSSITDTVLDNLKTTPQRATSRAAVGNLVSQLVASDLDALADGASVTSWTDKITGNAFTFANASTSPSPGVTMTAPIIAKNSFSNKTAVRFNGTSSGLGGNFPATNKPFTFIFVVRPVEAVGDALATGPQGVLWFTDVVGRLEVWNGLGLIYDTGTSSVNKSMIVSARSTNDGTSSALINGIGVQGSSGTDANAMGYTSIGYDTGFNTRFLNGDIAEILVYSGALTSTQQAQIDTILSDEYSITVNDYIPATITYDTVTITTLPSAVTVVSKTSSDTLGVSVTESSQKVGYVPRTAVSLAPNGASKPLGLYMQSDGLINAAPANLVDIGIAVVNVKEHTRLATWRTQNPDIVALAYLNMTFTKDYEYQDSYGDNPMVSEWSWLTYPTTGVSYGQAHETREDWFAHKVGTSATAANRQPSTIFNGAWMMNVGNVDYQNQWASNAINFCRLYGFDGVMADDLLAWLVPHLSGGDATLEWASSADHRVAAQSFLANVGAKFKAAGLHFAPNLSDAWRIGNTAMVNDWAPNVSGFMFEHFTSTYQGTARIPSDVLPTNMQYVLNTQAGGAYALGVNYHPVADKAAMRAGRAVMEIVRDSTKRTAYAYQGVTSAGAEENVNPIDPAWTMDLGTATGAAVSVAQNGATGNAVAWHRTLTKGFVAFNPSGAPGAVTFTSPIDGRRSSDNSLITSGTTFTLPADSAEIIVVETVNVTKSSSDTLTPAVADASVSKGFGSSDTLIPAIADSSTQFAKTTSDTVTPAIVDTSAVNSTGLAQDSLTPAIVDASQPIVISGTVTKSASDTVLPIALDTSIAIVMLSSSDTLTPSITETSSFSSIPLLGADTLSATISESSSLVRRENGRVVLFEDHFVGAAGTSPNSAYWTAQTGAGGWGNNELQTYSADPTNLSLDGNSNLAIVARRDGSGNYTSARIHSSDKVAHVYGRFEARIKVPSGLGLWPAFWMMGDESDYGQWPLNGEIDVVEIVNDMKAVFGNIHGPKVSSPTTRWNLGVSKYFNTSLDDGQFHTFAVERNIDEIHWFVDNIYYGTIRKSEISSDYTWVFNDRPFHMLLNMAVGGGMTETQTPDTSKFPATMLVDYVRVLEPQAYTPPALPKISTLIDDFSTENVALWANYENASVAATGGALTILPTTSYPQLSARDIYDLRDSSISLDIRTFAQGGGSSKEFVVNLLSTGSSLVAVGHTANGNAWFARYRLDGGSYDDVYIAKNTLDKFIRIREASGTLYWERSTDGTTWTNLRTPIITPAINLDKVRPAISAGYWDAAQSAPTTPFEIEAVNIVTPINTIQKSASDTVIGQINEGTGVYPGSVYPGALYPGGGSSNVIVLSDAKSVSDSILSSITDTSVGIVQTTPLTIKSTTDTVASAVGDASVVVGLLSRTDTVSTTISDASAFGTIVVTSSDSLSSIFSDISTRDAILAGLGSDTITPGITDASTLLKSGGASPIGSDTALTTITESSSIAYSLARVDTVQPGIAEASSTQNTITSTDSFVVSLTEANVVLLSKSAADTLTNTVDDTGAVFAETPIILIVKSAVDTVRPVQTETSLVRQPQPAIVKIWDGSAWVVGKIKIWNGATWITPVIRVWNGTKWV